MVNLLFSSIFILLYRLLLISSFLYSRSLVVVGSSRSHFPLLPHLPIRFAFFVFVSGDPQHGEPPGEAGDSGGPGDDYREEEGDLSWSLLKKNIF